MTQQAHKICWLNVARHLEYVHANPANKGITDLYLRDQPKQGQDLNAFVVEFEQAIEETSRAARAQYPAAYAKPNLDEVIINDDTTKKMLPTLERIGGLPYQSCKWPRRLNNFFVEADKRKMAALLAPYEWNDCYRFDEANGDSYTAIEMVKILLLLDEMETLLRICAHPDNDLLSWWKVQECQDMDFDKGWNHVCINALKGYICLNVMLCCSELWDWPKSGEQMDYRDTASYQRVLRETTMSVDSDLPCLLHRDFFGIKDNHFSTMPTLKAVPQWADASKARYDRNKYPYGLLRFKEFCTVETRPYYARSDEGLGFKEYFTDETEPYTMPSADEVATARCVLDSRRLPAEIQTIIIKHIEQDSPGRRRMLGIAHEPLHQFNRKELCRYLEDCWQLLQRCDMLAKALGDQIPWKALVSRCIADLWVSNERRSKTYIQRVFPRPRSPYSPHTSGRHPVQDDFSQPCGRLALGEYCWYEFL